MAFNLNISESTISSCYGCKPPIRNEICHSTCQKYKDAVKANEERKMQIKAQKDNEALFHGWGRLKYGSR